MKMSPSVDASNTHGIRFPVWAFKGTETPSKVFRAEIEPLNNTILIVEAVAKSAKCRIAKKSIGNFKVL